ncbi:MAG: hypothetical protein R3297_06555, partial [Desulfobulbales bacterium]|nr:hypothetical protein [Desulfobulbales bacterium]
GEIQLAAQSPQETEAMFAALSAQNVSRPSSTASDSLPPAQIELKPQPVVPTQPKVEKITLQPVVPTQPKVEKIVPQPVVQTPPEAEKIDLQADKTPKIKPVPAATEPETPAPRKTVLNTSEQVASVMAATTGARKDKQQIIAFIEDWRQAWVSKQIDPYIAFYDASFKSGGKNLAQWKAHKKNLNETYAFISVNLSDITVDWTDRGATVSFLQEYRSDRYSAKGKKTLYLVHDSNGWKIKREVYSRI